MPYDGTIEDALASAARGHVDLIELGHTAEHEEPVGCHWTQAGSLGPGIPNPLSGLSPPYAKPEAWLPIASRSTTTLGTPDFAR